MKRHVIFHPLLFAAAPVLSLYFVNAQYVYWHETSGTMLIMLGLATGLWALLGFWLKNLEKSAVLTSLFLFTFATYGRIWDVTGALSANLKLGLWLAGLAIAAWLIRRSRRDFNLANRLLNLVSIAWLVTIIVPYVYFTQFMGQEARVDIERALNNWLADAQVPDSSCAASPTSRRPDIYYIILDGYARSDTLQQVYGGNNSEFLSFLKARGFYVADRSASNYVQTMLSLSSSLNFQYLDDLAHEVTRVGGTGLPVRGMIARNRVFERLQQLGYLIVSFATGYTATDAVGVGERLAPFAEIGPFQASWLNSTPLPALLNVLAGFSQHIAHRARVLFTLGQLPQFAHDPTPTFTLAHILAPHPPFVFGLNGEDVYTDRFRPFTLEDGSEYHGTRAEYIAAYRDQLGFITGKVESVIEQILVNSSEPPIIILQGDHGPKAGLNEVNTTDADRLVQFPILNAYYFPDRNYTELYPAISPVNSFRVILNQFFCGHYPLLPDYSYLSPAEPPFDLSVGDGK
jgi:hypothetical protein